MKAGKTNGTFLLTLIAFAICALAVGSPAGADPTGSQYEFLFGGTVTAANGDTLDLFFTDSIVVDLRSSKGIVKGEGVYTMVVGGVPKFGTWEATQVESYHSYGRFSPPFDFAEAGKGKVKIALAGDVTGTARLTIHCSLPGIPAPPVKDHDGDGDIEGVEGFSVDRGSLHFGDGGRTQRTGTLFIRLVD